MLELAYRQWKLLSRAKSAHINSKSVGVIFASQLKSSIMETNVNSFSLFFVGGAEEGVQGILEMWDWLYTFNKLIKKGKLVDSLFEIVFQILGSYHIYLIWLKKMKQLDSIENGSEM